MMKDSKGRKWHLRFRQHQQGWKWQAQCKTRLRMEGPERVFGQNSEEFFTTKALAEDHARRSIQESDAVGDAEKYFSQFATKN
jgi:hypothetical protein